MTQRRAQLPARLEVEAKALRRDLYLLRLDSQRQPLLGSHFKSQCNSIFDILDGFLLGRSLTHTARYGRAFADPHTILISLKRDVEFHSSLRLPDDYMS